jgi:maltose alpha-D-glucosyltransferase / alpha-amylase
MSKKDQYLEDNPFWYKDAIVYEMHIRAFYDANSDGIGDFKGLTEKLDYLEGLGITAIWLLPFYPSPLKDDGYDIADYFNIHPNYGTLRDFEELLRAAHRRGIRVITELVLNHTSDRHAWFQSARRAKPGSATRNFYVWSESPDRYKDARIIFKDFETSNWAWDPLANAYYWHRFYSHQPDLNFENPEVQKAILEVMDYWLNMGVDGLRLDAVPYLLEREGTNCENLPETHEFLRKLRAHVDSKYKNRMLLAEANQWPEDAAAYFGSGDECHMAFHFPLMPRMFMAVKMEDRFPIVEILDQTPSIPEISQWALFLRNHDELTLEMVTDEERDYMYRVYARDPSARINLGIRRRLAPLLENDRRKIELMNVLLFAMPGTPVIYYGDEIGMGDNQYLGDRNGVRTPMQWSADRNAGFSRTNPQKLYLPITIDPEYHYEVVNVENQERNHASLLWWMKRMIAARNQSKALGRGSLEFLFPDNPKVLAFVRRYQDEKVLVVVNLSRHPQTVELDLSKCLGCIPEEVFGRNRFPTIEDKPYVLAVGAYGYYLFSLKEKPEAAKIEAERAIPEIGISESWHAVLQGKMRVMLERTVLPYYLKACRWFGGKGRTIHEVKIVEHIPIGRSLSATQLTLLEVSYTEGLPEIYLLPLGFASGDEARKIMEEHSKGAIARLKIGDNEGLIYDGVYSEEFRQELISIIARRYRMKGLQGELTAYPGKAFRKITHSHKLAAEGSQVMKAEQTNTSLLYGNIMYLKLYRRLDEGVNPDTEIGRFLTEKRSFSNIPSFAGAVEYGKPHSEPIVIGMLQSFVANQGDAWRYTLDEIARYLERVLSKASDVPLVLDPTLSPLGVAYQEIPLLMQELIGGVYLEMAILLGKRTAELHHALSSEVEDPSFAPEPFTALYQRSMFQSMHSLALRVLQLLKKNLRNLPENFKKDAEGVVNREKEIMDRLKTVLKARITGMRVRIHGDYHLGQVLYTGNDFIIIDFEGEPARPLSERRLKRSPLRDVSGMLRSFHYAAYTGLFHHTSVRREDLPTLRPWAELWPQYVGGAFLRSYLDTTGNAALLPKDSEGIDILLNAFLLNKAIYELGYELNNRPDWVMIPLKGILSILDIKGSASLFVEIQKAYPLGLPNP